MAVFGEGLVSVIERYVKKGSKLYIEGKNKTRKWQDRDGNDKFTTEVVLQGPGCSLTMLDSANGGGQNRTDDYQRNQDSRSNGYSERQSGTFDLHDEIPF